MNTTSLDHPAIRLGFWLKSARQARGFVKRVFAEAIHFTPSKYTEVEAGVVSWVETKNEDAIVATLSLENVVLVEFKQLLKQAREHAALLFSDLFTRTQLMPLRSRLHADRAISEMERDLILDAVFTPLS